MNHSYNKKKNLLGGGIPLDNNPLLRRFAPYLASLRKERKFFKNKFATILVFTLSLSLIIVNIYYSLPPPPHAYALLWRLGRIR